MNKQCLIFEATSEVNTMEEYFVVFVMVLAIQEMLSVVIKFISSPAPICILIYVIIFNTTLSKTASHDGKK